MASATRLAVRLLVAAVAAVSMPKAARSLRQPNRAHSEQWQMAENRTSFKKGHDAGFAPGSSTFFTVLSDFFLVLRDTQVGRPAGSVPMACPLSGHG
jgi:hypothetical protein